MGPSKSKDVDTTCGAILIPIYGFGAIVEPILGDGLIHLFDRYSFQIPTITAQSR